MRFATDTCMNPGLLCFLSCPLRYSFFHVLSSCTDCLTVQVLEILLYSLPEDFPCGDLLMLESPKVRACTAGELPQTIGQATKTIMRLRAVCSQLYGIRNTRRQILGVTSRFLQVTLHLFGIFLGRLKLPYNLRTSCGALLLRSLLPRSWRNTEPPKPMN